MYMARARSSKRWSAHSTCPNWRLFTADAISSDGQFVVSSAAHRRRAVGYIARIARRARQLEPAISPLAGRPLESSLIVLTSGTAGKTGGCTERVSPGSRVSKARMCLDMVFTYATTKCAALGFATRAPRHSRAHAPSRSDKLPVMQAYWVASGRGTA
jgi:hypothetical protein